MLGNYKYAYTASSALLKTGPGGIHSVLLAGGSANSTLTVYDNTAGSGTVICVLAALIGTSASVTLDVAFSKGCYATLSGTGASCSLAIW